MYIKLHMPVHARIRIFVSGQEDKCVVHIYYLRPRAPSPVNKHTHVHVNRGNVKIKKL